MPNLIHLDGNSNTSSAGRPPTRNLDYIQVPIHHPIREPLSRKYAGLGILLYHELWRAIGMNDGHVIDLREDEELEDFFLSVYMEKDIGKEILDWMAKQNFIDVNLWSSRIVWCQDFIEKHRNAWARRKKIPTKPDVPATDEPVKITYIKNVINDDINTNDDVNNGINDDINTHRKGEDKKEKKRIKKEGKGASSPDVPSLDLIVKYFLENNYSREAAIKFYETYAGRDWTDTKGNQIKDWQMKAQKVWFTPEHKISALEKNAPKTRSLTPHIGFRADGE